MVKTITKKELLDMTRTMKNLMIVDVLSPESYVEQHIPQAISIPLERLGRMSKTLLNKNDTVVVYCSGFTCEASTKAARKLMKLGYKKVYEYKGGLEDYFSETSIIQNTEKTSDSQIAP